MSNPARTWSTAPASAAGLRNGSSPWMFTTMSNPRVLGAPRHLGHAVGAALVLRRGQDRADPGLAGHGRDLLRVGGDHQGIGDAGVKRTLGNADNEGDPTNQLQGLSGQSGSTRVWRE